MTTPCWLPPHFHCTWQISSFFLEEAGGVFSEQKEVLLQQKLYVSSMNPTCCPDVPRALLGNLPKGYGLLAKVIFLETSEINQPFPRVSSHGRKDPAGDSASRLNSKNQTTACASIPQRGTAFTGPESTSCQAGSTGTRVSEPHLFLFPTNADPVCRG